MLNYGSNVENVSLTRSLRKKEVLLVECFDRVHSTSPVERWSRAKGTATAFWSLTVYQVFASPSISRMPSRMSSNDGDSPYNIPALNILS